MGKIFCIMGKSSSGKDTVYKRLQELVPEIRKITMYTTRPIREGETEGDEYHFVDVHKLRCMEENGEVIESRTYNTKCGLWTYFTANDGQIDLEKNNYLIIGTLQSFDAMKKYFGKDKIVGIYLEVDDAERLSRALEREKIQKNPKLEEMCRRFLADQEDFSEENLMEAGIETRFSNNEIDSCLEKIQKYIRKNM